MTDVSTWISEKALELSALLEGSGATDEALLQNWLERHPAFVPGSRGVRGMTGWQPWPAALITQPRLTGIQAKVPDFCWLSVDSAELTAVLVEIEVPSKRWQHKKGTGQSAQLTQARDQINAWKTWFSDPTNQMRFLDDYLVPSSLRYQRFTQHYVLVHGSREEYMDSPARVAARSGGMMSAHDESLMSFDRLVDAPSSDAAHLGCVARRGDAFEVVAVPATFRPESLHPNAQRVTRGYESAIDACADLDEDERSDLKARLADVEPGPVTRYRFRP